MDTVDAENWTSLVHPDDRERVERQRKELLVSAEPYEIEYRLWHHSGEYRWLRLKATPKLGENGRVLRWYGTSADIHLEKTISLERELVAQELDHRIKNIFTLVNGLVGLSARESPELLPALDILRKRLEALHNAHQYLRISGAQPGSTASGGLKGLIEAILRPYSGSGGALAATDGRLSIHISNRAQTLRLRWVEATTAIPALHSSHRGYGSTLLKLTVERQLSGRIFRRQGRGYLCYLLTLPGMRAER
jgi:two-component sensor histidine kinase